VSLFALYAGVAVAIAQEEGELIGVDEPGYSASLGSSGALLYRLSPCLDPMAPVRDRVESYLDPESGRRFSPEHIPGLLEDIKHAVDGIRGCLGPRISEAFEDLDLNQLLDGVSVAGRVGEALKTAEEEASKALQAFDEELEKNELWPDLRRGGNALARCRTVEVGYVDFDSNDAGDLLNSQRHDVKKAVGVFAEIAVRGEAVFRVTVLPVRVEVKELHVDLASSEFRHHYVERNWQRRVGRSEDPFASREDAAKLGAAWPDWLPPKDLCPRVEMVPMRGVSIEELQAGRDALLTRMRSDRTPIKSLVELRTRIEQRNKLALEAAVAQAAWQAWDSIAVGLRELSNRTAGGAADVQTVEAGAAPSENPVDLPPDSSR